MPTGYVRHVIDGPVSVEHLFRWLATAQDTVFWLDDSLAETVSYLGWGEPVEADATSTDGDWAVLAIDEAGALPVSRVGWLSYSERAETLGVQVVSNPDDRTRILRVECAVEVDHRTGQVAVIAESWTPATMSFRDDVIAWAAADRDNPDALVPTAEAAVAFVATWADTPEQYAEMIEVCREHIRNGDVYQVCLTTQATVPGVFDPVEVYLRLRAAAPTRTSGFIRIDGIALLSASPEVFVTVDDGTVTTKPIKGTRPRSTDPTADAAAAEELRGNVKERAENLMIVDLSRNDLSRIADPASVTVPSLFDVESYSTVHQLVSTVQAHVNPGTRMSDVVRAMFPAGSMTGTPKRRATQILAELEAGERGIYSGAFGRVGAGSMALAMTIRTIVITADGARLGVGGGLTIDSVAADEVREVGFKARALLAALDASPNPFLTER
ncbi:anthranilate synthase component 1 [Microbacteriaceae bacterium MWH-Ta3]|nr:anthranilate synthase component 1 [Microbacteriaceae bacterium MWH-Ta3]